MPFLVMDIDTIYADEVLVVEYTSEFRLFDGILPLLKPTGLHTKFYVLLHVLVGYGYKFLLLMQTAPRPIWTPTLCNLALSLYDNLVVVIKPNSYYFVGK